MKKSKYFDQNGFIETMNEYERYLLTIYKKSNVIIDYNCNRNLEYLVAKYRKLKGGE